MQELMSTSEMSRADLVDAAATATDRSRSTVNAVVRGDVECPPMDVLEGFAAALGVDTAMLVDAAGRDGCEYSEMPSHYSSGGDGNDDEEAEMAADGAAATETDTTTMSTNDGSDDPQERIAELQDRVAQLEDERETVAREYAEALAEHSEVLDADDYVDRFEVAELRERYDGLEQASLAEEPAVRSGDGDSTSETANLSADEADRVAELEEKMATWEGRDSRLADNQVEEIEAELADLRGENE